MIIINENIINIADPVFNYSLDIFPEINTEVWRIDTVVSKRNNVTVSVTDDTHFSLTPVDTTEDFFDVISINLVYQDDGTSDFFTYRTVEFCLNVTAVDLMTWEITNNNNSDVSVGFQDGGYSGAVSIYTATGTQKPKKSSFTERTAAFMVNLHPGETLYMFSESMTTYNIASAGLQFRCTADVSFGGDIMGMLKDHELTANCFMSLFRDNTVITTAPALPATTLTDRCYSNMFRGCTSLTTAPALPATTLTQYCYQYMFHGCTSLTTAPALPATTLAFTCYNGMFNGCTSLTTAPALPATTLAAYCYQGMFNGCTALTTAPSTLPATSLAGSWNCYQNMFNGCTSLTTAPALPAMTLDESCYESMFEGCTGLTTAPALPATEMVGRYGMNYGSSSYKNMFKGCTSLTTAPALPATKLAPYNYQSMFEGCTALTASPALPAETLSTFCYRSMFKGCTSLTTAPALPATKLTPYNYLSMFEGCTSLTTAPELPAESGDNATSCYASMFKGCTALTTVPVLAFTTLGDRHCESMFEGCTSLTTIPSKLLPTDLKTGCYSRMFYGCTSLTTAPELPAETLTVLIPGNYQNMFDGCTSLNYIKAMFTNWSSSALSNWVNNVASTGTFVMNASATWDPADHSGVSGIPANWTVLTAAS